MKHKLNVTAVVVTVLFYGLCGTTQAQDTTITFNGTAGHAAFVGLALNATYTEGGYTLTQGNTSSGFMDNDYATAVGASALDDDFLVAFNTSGPWTFTRVGGSPFSAKSLVVGALDVSSRMTLTGYINGGGTVTTEIFISRGTATTNYLEGFHNLDSLAILNAAGKSCLDSLTLTSDLAPSPASRVVIDFNGRAAVNASVQLAVPSQYYEDGYSLSNANTSAFFVDKGWNADAAAFEGTAMAFFTQTAPLVFRRVDAQPFSAESLVIGSRLQATTLANSRLLLIGNVSGGGTVTNTVNGARGGHKKNFLSGLNNLTSLEIWPLTVGVGYPIIDDLVLITDVAPTSLAASSVVVDFNGVAASGTIVEFFVGGFWYSEDGYAMTVEAQRIYLLDKGWTANADVAPFDDDLLWFQDIGVSSVSFERQDGLTFNTISLVVGAHAGAAQLSLTGHKASGGTVTTTLSPAQGSHGTVELSGFSNLTSLTLVSLSAAGRPLVDNLAFEPYVPSGTIIMIQ